MMLRNFCLVLLASLLLSACSATNHGPSLNGRDDHIVVQPPKTVSYPVITKASYYSNKLQGRKTASGITFDQEAFTAAHRHLPLPSLVKVTSLDNKKSVVVVINDRGPFKGQQTIDLSKHAAKKLGMLGLGTADVKVEYLADETKKFVPKTLKPLNYKQKKSIHSKMHQFAVNLNAKHYH